MTPTDDLITCPNCTHAFAPAAGNVQQCPQCAEQFFIEAEDEPLDDDDRELRQNTEDRYAARREQLDDRHIRATQLEKRSLYRAAGWVVIAGMLCVGAGGQLVWISVRDAAARPAMQTTIYVAMALALMLISLRFFRRARALARQADAIKQPEPTTPPDFTGLGDGSQFADNLDRMTGERGREQGQV